MFDDLISKASVLYKVPESWIRAVIQTESSFDPEAFRPEASIGDASYGLMQLLYRTAKGLGYQGAATGLYDPETNIMLGTKLLGTLRSKYGDDFRRIYSAYNSGRPDLWQTSKEVATHVAHAVSNLQQFITAEVGELTATVEESPGASASLAALIVLVLLWAWSGKRK